MGPAGTSPRLRLVGSGARTLKGPGSLLPFVGKAWIKARVKDTYYRRAKAEGYRSRAAYKLIQIDRRFRILREGDVVVDLGAAPGGWSQVAREAVGPRGRVVAVDLGGLPPLERVAFVRGDLREPSTREALAATVPEGVDVVLSDMSPRLSGSGSLDHARSVDLAEAALEAAEGVLREGGRFVAKVFQGDLYPAYLRRVQAGFRSARGFTPQASPAGSAEIYVVAQGWRASR